MDTASVRHAKQTVQRLAHPQQSAQLVVRQCAMEQGAVKPLSRSEMGWAASPFPCVASDFGSSPAKKCRRSNVLVWWLKCHIFWKAHAQAEQVIFFETGILPCCQSRSIHQARVRSHSIPKHPFQVRPGGAAQEGCAGVLTAGHIQLFTRHALPHRSRSHFSCRST